MILNPWARRADNDARAAARILAMQHQLHSGQRLLYVAESYQFAQAGTKAVVREWPAGANGGGRERDSWWEGYARPSEGFLYLVAARDGYGPHNRIDSINNINCIIYVSTILAEASRKTVQRAERHYRRQVKALIDNPAG